METRTTEEIAELKRAWRVDPCWDIATTEGFEAHRTELETYQTDMEALWEARTEKRIRERAAEMGIPENLTLAKCIMSLEYRITQLERA